MATALGTLVASAARAAKTPYTDNVFLRGVIGRELASKMKSTSGGSQIDVPKRFSKPGQTRARNEYDAISYERTETVKTPAMDWAYYESKGQVHEEDVSKASGKNKVLDMMKVELSGASNELRETLFTDFYTGSGAYTDADQGTAQDPPEIEGLDVICHKTNTYGDIDRSVAANSEWRGNVATEASLTLLEFMEYIDAVTWDDQMPEFAVMSLKLRSRMSQGWGMLRRRFTSKRLELDFDSFTIMDVPIVTDQLCPDDTIYLLNLDYLDWYKPTGADAFKVETFDHESELWGARFRILPMFQLVCSEPKFQYKINVTNSTIAAES